MPSPYIGAQSRTTPLMELDNAQVHPTMVPDCLCAMHKLRYGQGISGTFAVTDRGIGPSSKVPSSRFFR
jgi:hypothetical protein